eukprot:351151-Chlamydomonas_euryale.AAC.6
MLATLPCNAPPQLPRAWQVCAKAVSVRPHSSSAHVHTSPGPHTSSCSPVTQQRSPSSGRALSLPVWCSFPLPAASEQDTVRGGKRGTRGTQGGEKGGRRGGEGQTLWHVDKATCG